MAIPGYTPTVSESWVRDTVAQDFGYGGNNDLWNQVCDYLGVTRADMNAAISSLIDRVESFPNMPLIIREDGTIDLGAIFGYTKDPVPSPLTQLNVVGNIADKNDGMTIGIVDGVWTVFFGEAAILWVAQSVLPIPTEIPTPQLRLVSLNGFVGVYDGGPNKVATPIQQPTFVATYQTRYGESGLSNVIICPLTESWASVTLDIEDNPPTLATKVYYYRLFGQVFRRVKEVDIIR